VKQIHAMEAPMHGTFGRINENRNSAERDWSVGFFALPALLVSAMVVLAVLQPAASNWISEAAQAEFVGVTVAEVAPIQLAQPPTQTRLIKVH
jgi:hypothetical protein